MSEIKYRLGSIELLKALGIIFLIVLHQIVWLYTIGDTGGLVFADAYRIVKTWGGELGLHVLGFGVPLLAGLTYHLSFPKKYRSWAAMLKRALGLIGLGFLLNLLAWGPEGFLDWDVLHFIGLSMIVAYPFLRYIKNDRGVWVLAVAGLITLTQSHYFPFYGEANSYFYQIFFGNKEGGIYWPVCPWFSVFAGGIVLSYCLKLKQKKLLWIILSVGVLLWAYSLLTSEFWPVYDVENIWGPALFKPRIGFMLGILGLQFMLITGIELVLVRNTEWVKHLENPVVKAYGQGILWIYFWTIIIGYHVTNFVTYNFTFTFHESWMILGGLLMGCLVLGFVVGYLSTRKTKVEYITSFDL